jgi:hypothetical protein
VRGAERNARCVGKGSLELFVKWPVSQLRRLNQLVMVRAACRRARARANTRVCARRS